MRTAGLYLAAMTVVAVACGGEDVGDAGSSERADDPAAVITGVAPPLRVSTDAEGRPYDVVVRDGDGHEIDWLTHFVVPEGELRVADGIALGTSSGRLSAGEVVEVDFPAAGGERVELDVFTIRETGTFSSLLGVRFETSGATVNRWADWEYAYGTDGGLGGVTTQHLIDVAHANDWDEVSQPFSFGDDWEPEYWLEDLDGISGDDFFVFANGFGDGAFPMARGFDRDGALVALVVWDNRYPWRLAVSDGRPPDTVRLREEEFIRCMEEPVLVELDGSCPTEL